MDHPTIREVVAVFDDAEKLEIAVSQLQSNGIDRSELSFLARRAHWTLIGGSVAGADDPRTSREPFVSDTDLRQGRVLGTGLAATIAAFAAAGFTVATGGVAAATIAAAAVAAGGVGAASTLLGRKVAEDQASFLDKQLARGGVLLSVRTRAAATRASALEILRRYSAHVYLHDLPAEVVLGSPERLRYESRSHLVDL